MRKRRTNAQEVLHAASGVLADSTALAADLATNAAQRAAVWAEKAPGQARDIWHGVASNVDSVLTRRARRRRRRAWLIGAGVAVAVGVGVVVASQCRKPREVEVEESAATASAAAA